MADEPQILYDVDLHQSHISVPFPKRPPRLGVALLWAKPGRTPDCQSALEKDIRNEKAKPVALGSKDTFSAELRSLLDHIWKRLERGLWEAWSSKWGYHLRPPVRAQDETDEAYEERVGQFRAQRVGLGFFENTPEERWARVVTEMFVFAPYAGAGGFVNGAGSQDDDSIYKLYPKVHSIGVACQHLSTYVALTRGIPYSSIPGGFDASPLAGRAGLASPTKEELSKPPLPRPAWLDAAPGDWRKYDLWPGDVIAGDFFTNAQVNAYFQAYNEWKKDSTKKKPDPLVRNGFAHIASVLRRWPPVATPDAPYKLQWIDTGVMTKHGDYITQDHEWCDAHGQDTVRDAFAEATERRGFGRVPEATDVGAAADQACSALPLGFARLVIAQQGDWTVRYVSGILPMWFGDQRFHFCDYLWSLRELPAQGLVALWIVYGAVGATLRDQIASESSGPSRTAADLFAASKGASLREAVVVTSAPRVYRANIKSTEEWSSFGRDTDGEAAEFADEPAANDSTPHDAAIEKTQTNPGSGGFRSWLPLRLGALTGTDVWARLMSTSTASTEWHVPDLSVSGADGLIEASAADGQVPYFNLSLK